MEIIYCCIKLYSSFLLSKVKQKWGKEQAFSIKFPNSKVIPNVQRILCN